MRKKRIVMLTIVVALGAAGTGFAQENAANQSSQPQRLGLSDDYHIAVRTNRPVYHHKEVLKLSVHLVNDGDGKVIMDIPRQPEDSNYNGVEEICQGWLENEDVDVAVMPKRHNIIGYAVLRRLGPSPDPQAIPGHEESVPEGPIRQRFALPLFGSPRILSHSSRIISVANIALELAQPQDESPQDVQTQTADETVELIPAVEKCIVLKPGYYLLSCRIHTIKGSGVVEAQKIIHISKKTPSPAPAIPTEE